MIQANNVRLEYGIYRDGDNNLDDAQSAAIGQALETSAQDPAISFSIEDTTARRGLLPAHYLRTESYDVDQGRPHNVRIEPPKNMSARATLAAFVDRALDRAEKHHAAATWIELVDHGGGDAGGLESDQLGGFMSEDDIAGAISDGVAMHARAHPGDAARHVDGVVANQWQSATQSTRCCSKCGWMSAKEIVPRDAEVAVNMLPSRQQNGTRTIIRKYGALPTPLNLEVPRDQLIAFLQSAHKDSTRG